MQSYRIGNDIPFRWPIYTGRDIDRIPSDLTGRKLTLEAISKTGKSYPIEMTTDGNIVQGTFYGKDQKAIGPYVLVLTENKDEVGMRTIDTCDFVELVDRSYKATGGSNDVIHYDVLELSGSRVATYSGVVDSELSDTSANPVENRTVTKALNTIGKKTAEGLASKQDTIEDLEAIRHGALLGETSVQDISHLATKTEVTEGFAAKLDKNAVVQESGTGTNKIMSQKAVTEICEALAKAIELKQAKLTVGRGISIEGGVISSTLDTNPFVVVSSLPATGNSEKIYLVPAEKQEEGNLTDEWIWNNGKWERLGSAKVDLTAYAKTEDVEAALEAKQDTISDLDTIRSNAQKGNKASSTIASIVEAGYVFAGIATSSTDPGTPDAKVFYIANGKGTYEKFGGINVTEDEVVVLYWDTAWHKVSTGIASQAKLSELEMQITNKVDKIEGKGLSTNDFTDRDKSILYGIENYDDVIVINGAGSYGKWVYSYKTFKDGQRVRVIMFTPTGITLPEGVATTATCIQVGYKTEDGGSKQNLLVRQGYDYPIRPGLISEGVITIEGGNTTFIRMFAICATTEKFGFAIKAIEDNAVNKCYAPSFMLPKFNALSFDSIYTHGRVGTYTFNFLHFSDIHQNDIELKRIQEFSELYQAYLCDVINTGDSVKGLGTEDFSWYAENGSKFLNVIGNHDSATSQSSGGWTGLGKQATYDKYIAPFIADWGVVGSSGNNYYYKDYVSSRNYGGVQIWVKLRLIILDCMFYDQAQNTWLESTLNDANVNGFDVMIAIHTSPAPADVIHSTYTSLNATIIPAGWASYSTTNAAQVVKEFIDNGGKFICWLGGHVHRDMMGKIADDNRQLVVLVETCSNNVQGDLDRPYIEGEYEYADAFNIIGIDTYRHLLKIFKVGYEYDGAMRRKGTFVYDYETSMIVFNG